MKNEYLTPIQYENGARDANTYKNIEAVIENTRIDDKTGFMPSDTVVDRVYETLESRGDETADYTDLKY